MKMKRKLFLLFAVCLLSGGSVLTAHAVKLEYTKGTWVLKERQSKTVTVKGLGRDFWVHYYGGEELYTYQLLPNAKIRISAVKAGAGSISLSNGTKRDTYSIVVMPGKNKAVKTKNTSKGTRITYKKVALTLPKEWKTSNYIFLTGKNYISFHSKLNYKGAHGGHVFTIQWCSSKQWKQYSGQLPNYRYIGKKGKTVYYMTQPTDVQFYYQLPKYRGQYMKLEGTVDAIFKSIKIK